MLTGQEAISADNDAIAASKARWNLWCWEDAVWCYGHEAIYGEVDDGAAFEEVDDAKCGSEFVETAFRIEPNITTICGPKAISKTTTKAHTSQNLGEKHREIVKIEALSDCEFASGLGERERPRRHRAPRVVSRNFTALPDLGGVWQMRSMGCVVDDAILLDRGHVQELIFAPDVQRQRDALVAEAADAHDGRRAFHSTEVAAHGSALFKLA